MLGPHAPYTCPKELLLSVAQAAGENDLPVHIHVAETQHEVEESLAATGATPIQYLDRIGLLECRTVAAHCVWLDDRDIDILVERQVGVAHCPASNMKLASGFARTPELLSAGAVVGLGTDGAASNNRLDLFNEMYLAATVHKVRGGDPTLVKAGEALAVVKETLKKLADEGLAQAELDDVKTFLTGSYALRFDTNDKIAGQLLGILEEDLGIDYINKRNAMVEAITLDQVKAQAKRLLDFFGRVEFLEIANLAGRPLRRHEHRRGAARAEAFHMIERELAVGRRLSVINPQRLLELIGAACGPAQLARHVGAYLQVILAHRV